MVTRLVRHYDQDDRQCDAAIHWDTIRRVTAESVRKTGSTRFRRQRLASTYSTRKQQDEVRVPVKIPKIPWLTSAQFNDTLVE